VIPADTARTVNSGVATRIFKQTTVYPINPMASTGQTSTGAAPLTLYRFPFVPTS
jgi:hypothetical protein